jgi:hypothetical protein
MKIVCECGEVTKLVDGEDGSGYTYGEGWYKKTCGTIDLNQNHYQIFFICNSCGKEEWIFT